MNEETILTEKLLGTTKDLTQWVIDTARNPYSDIGEFEYYVALLAFSKAYPQASQESTGIFFRDNRFNRISPFKYTSKVHRKDDLVTMLFTGQTGRGSLQSITMENPTQGGEPRELTLVERAHYQNKDGTGETNYHVNKEFYVIVPYIAEEKEDSIERIIGQMKERISALEKLSGEQRND